MKPIFAIQKLIQSRRFLLPMGLASLILLASCSSREGALVIRSLESQSLTNNIMGIPVNQQLAIYLPPSYREGSRRYPVLYFLPNFDNCLWRYSGGDYQGFHLRNAMDELIVKGAAREMIVVMPNVAHMLGASWYRNSPLTGNWEDYVVKDVVEYMDSHFRTIPTATSRGLAGHGMGGMGALELAMKHPDRFGCVYAMSPALFDENGLRDSGIVADKQLALWKDRLDAWKGLDAETRRKSFRDFIQSRLNSPSRGLFLEGLSVSYAAAMAPDLSLAFPHIAFPEPGAHSPEATHIISRFENGFGGWLDKVGQYLSHGSSLRSIAIEYTKDDEMRWIPRGAVYVSSLMREMGVQNDLIVHDGGQESTLGWRLRTAMLPAMSKALNDRP